MDKAELIARLLSTFVVEMQDQLRVYNRELLALEREPSGEAARAAIAVLFRTVHSIKGAARSVEALRLSRTAHALEELLAQLRDGRRAVTPQLLSLLFQAADALEAAGQQLSAAPEARKPQVDAALDALVEQIGALQREAARPDLAVSQRPTVRPGLEQAPAAEPSAQQAAVREARPEGASEPAAQSGKPLSQDPQTGTVPPLHAGAKTWPDSAESRSSVVRVSVRRLDSLLAQAGELAVARRRLEIRRDEVEALHESLSHLRGSFRSLRAAARSERSELQLMAAKQRRALTQTELALERLDGELTRVSSLLRDDVANLERAAAPLEKQVHRARMLRFEEACDGLTRAVRDLSQAQHKAVELSVQGGDVELDRAIIESARVALLHLVRNAIDHGIEPADERARAGKPARGQLSIHAAVSGEHVRIELRDDGRGLDPAALRAEALRRGFTPPEDERELFRLIFAPGFSTTKLITEVSGRGVGLDVVKNLVDELGGELDVSSTLGAGCCFVLQLPATASTLRALLVRVGAQVFALPSRNVQRLLRVSPDEVAHTQGREVLPVADGAPLPLAALREVLELPAPSEPEPLAGKLAIVVLSAESRSAALVVDSWQSEQELVQKPLGRRVRRLRKVSGASLLPSGELALVLKPSELVQRVYAGAGLAGQLQAARKLSADIKRTRVLLADDSVTTRALERSILEAAGYEVLCAVDGAQAFGLLQERGADVVVSDVEMPNMDGFALTAAIRGSARFRNLPVVLLTALGSDADRARGLSSGADAYLVKRAFDQQLLLETLRQLT